MNKISEDLKDIIQKAAPLATRQEGDMHPNGKWVWTKTKSGKFDWRNAPNTTSQTSPTKQMAPGINANMNKHQKLKVHLAKMSAAQIKKFAQNPNGDPLLRQTAYDELVSRGEDVSDVDLKTGKYGAMKTAFGMDEDDDKDDSDDIDDDDSDDDEDELDNILNEGEEDEDWQDPEFIKKKFGDLKTKAQRIAYDDYVFEKKISSPSYKTPDKQIHQLNKLYAKFLKTDSPLLIASGGAGVGKTYNFHLVAKILNKKPFDSEVDNPGDSDYDYVEAPEVDSPIQLVSLLKEHNGKVILFDDSDNVLKNKDTAGILKKATASSGKRIVGKKSTGSGNVDPFEFTGQIVFLTNMNQGQLNKDENARAIMSRATKNDIYFTKKEQLYFIEKFKHQFEFTGIKRLDNKLEDIKERDEVFKIMRDNIKKIDPLKFNVRSMKEMLEVKRGEDVAEEIISNDPVAGKMVFGEVEDWRENVRDFLIKGSTYKRERNIEKAKNILNL